MRQWWTRCVGYLPGRTRQAMNKDARVELYFDVAKLCICSAWFLVHLPSHWTKERCVEVGVMYAAPSVVFFLFLQKISGQQILARWIKDFCFWICCSHPCFNKFKRFIWHGSQNACHHFIIIIIFFREKLWKRDLFFTVHYFLENLKQGWVKVA